MRTTLIGYSILLLLLWACMESPQRVELENPLRVEILSPTEGQQYKTSHVEIRWRGQPAFVAEYKHRVLGLESQWSVWTSDDTLSLELADGEYVFEIVGRSPGNITSPDTTERVVVRFSVDALPESSVFLMPLQTTVTIDDTVELTVMVKQVDNLMTAHLGIRFDEGKLSWDTLTVDTSFFGKGAGGIRTIRALEEIPDSVVAESLPSVFVSADPVLGIIDLVRIGFASPGVSGTGPLVTVRFNAIGTGRAVVGLTDETALRSSLARPITLNQPIILNMLENSVVEVLAPPID